MTDHKKKKWIISSGCLETEKQFIDFLRIDPIVAKILVNRGIKTVEEAKRFLTPELERMHDPFLMKGMKQAVTRIITAIEQKEIICIYGDYDVDGITSTSLFIIFFKALGIDVHYYIPDRLTEGYGVKENSFEKLKTWGCSLVITVDCGISNYDEVAQAKTMGIDFIITDHHQVPPRIPDACAVLNPHQSDCSYPFEFLSGIGVAYKLLTALRSDLQQIPSYAERLPNLKKLLDLVAIGSIADIVPLKGENRLFAFFGIEELNKTDKAGLKALKAVAGIRNRSVTSTDIGFILAPRINAVGRISQPGKGVTLLISSNDAESMNIALEIEKANKQRRTLQDQTFKSVITMITNDAAILNNPVIVLSSEGWHPGIIGIVASRVVEMYHKPTILISLTNDVGKGSGRSIPSFSLVTALKQCSHLLQNFGGHKMAAGLTIHKDEIAEFKTLFTSLSKNTLADDTSSPNILIDAELLLEKTNLHFFTTLSVLQPFGQDNPTPIFISRAISISDLRLIGKKKEHVKCVINNEKTSIEAIGFHMAFLATRYSLENSTFDITYTLQKNEWGGGKPTVQLNLKDIRPMEIYTPITAPNV